VSRRVARLPREIRAFGAMWLGGRFPGFFAPRLGPPVFLVGCARSGTTLLAELLGIHPRIARWSEANRVWDPGWYPWRPGRTDRLPLELDPQAFVDAWWRENAGRLDEIRATFGAYRWLGGDDLLLNKSPIHAHRLSHLAQAFPGARFVHLVRDGRAVVHSHGRKLLAQGKLREWPAEARERLLARHEDLYLLLARFWTRSLETASGCARRLRLTEDGRWRELRYEDLCADGAETLAGLHAFLGVEPRPGDAGWIEIRSQNRKWRDAFEPGLLARIEEEMHPVLEAYGYEPAARHAAVR